MVRVRTVLRCEGDADAGADADTVPIDIERRLDHRQQAAGEPDRLHGPADPRLYDGELIAAEAGDRVGVPRLLRQPFGDRLQQGVAGRMAQGVVHRLELVEIEAEQCQSLTALCMGQLRLQIETEQHAVGQIGERVVMRDVDQPRFGRTPFGHFLECGEPTALHRLVGHVECAAAGNLPGCDRPLVIGNELDPPLAHVAHVLGSDLTRYDNGVGHLRIAHVRSQRVLR